MNAPSMVACPKCGQRLKVEAAQTYSCPKCGTRFVAPGTQGMGASLPRTQNKPAAASSPLLSLDDDSPSAEENVRGSRTWMFVAVAALFVAIASAGAFFYFRHENRRTDDTAAAQQSSKEKPASKVEGRDSSRKDESQPPTVPPSVPQGNQLQTFPTLLPEPAKPREMSGDEVYRHLLPSAAYILTPTAVGSGVLIESDHRLVLTNAHVVEDYKTVEVFFASFDSQNQVITERKHYSDNAASLRSTGTVVSRHLYKDLALVQLDKVPEQARSVVVASEPVSTGSTVYSIGSSGVLPNNSGHLWRLSTGSVRGRFKGEFRYKNGAVRGFMCLETQSATNAGDSGGPMANGRVELVGIVQGGSPKDQLIDINVDVMEVREFVTEYFRSIRANWKEAQPEPSTLVLKSSALLDNSIAVLRGGTRQDRIIAARRLGKLGVHGRAAIPALLDSLETATDELRPAIGVALNLIGPPEAGAEKALVQALHSKLAIARAYAAKMFASSSPIPIADLKSVKEVLADESPEVRTDLIHAIEKIGVKAHPDAFGALLERLGDSDKSVRDAASAAVKALGPAEREDRTALLELIKHSDIRVRVAALESLRPLATTQEDVLSIWLPLLKDPEPRLRLASATALSSNRELLASASSEVLPLLADSDVAIRQVVAQAVKVLKDKPGVADKLSSRLEVESDAGVKATLAESLIALTPSDAKSLPVLRRFLKDSSPKVREESARKIATIAADATAAIPELIELIQDKSDGVRAAALTTLAAMGTAAKEAIPTAAGLFDRQTPESVLLAAAQLLGATGSDGIKHLETLCLKTLPESVRAEMCKSFCRANWVSETTHVWMIEQAETIVDYRAPITAALAKGVSKTEVQELLRRTLTYKPRKRGQKEMKYDLEYRKWSLITLRKLDLSSTANRETRQLVVDRLKYLVENDSTPEIVAEAKATLRALK